MKKRFNSTPGFLVIILFIVCTVNSNAATYHFSSTAGDDSRSAAQAQNENTPWKSIQKLNSIFQTLQPGDRILFKSGDSFPGEIIVTKSGNQGAPIFFGSYGSGPKPIITGLTKIQNWTSKGANIYEASVPQLNTPINVVVVDNEIKAKGRFPNENAPNKGYLTIESINGGTISSSQLQAPTNFSGAEVVIRKNNWIIDRHTINSHSGTSLNYNTAGSGYNPKVGFGFFIQNHPSTLDQNGEWYHDVQSNKILLYYDKGNPNNRIEVATISEIVNIQNNVGNLTFNNLRITGSNKNLVNLRSSANILFENCELEFIGENAIEGKGTNNLTISNSKIQNALNGGVFLGWSDIGLKITNTTFTNIFNFAGMSKNGDMQGQSIYMSESSSNGLIENNSFFNNGYIVINFNGNNTIIRNNYINTFNTVKDDGAAIYTYIGSGNVTFVNRKVINNIIINGIGAQEGTKPYGVNDFPYVEGIYMDDNSSGVEISGNTIANVRSAGIFLHNARNIDILNNNVYNVGYSLKFSHDNLGDPIRNITIRNNYFVQKSAEQMHVFATSKVDDIAQMGVFENNVFSKPINEYSNFIVQTPSERSTIDLEDWQKRYGKDQTSKRSPVQIPDGKITAINSGNKITNATYNANNNNSICWSANNNCEVSVIEDSPLDGRALQVNFPSPGILTINLGNIEKNKKYNLKFSIIANKKIVLNSYLRENQTPWNRISNQNSFEVPTSRSEINKIFTASETRNNAVLVLETSDTDITYHIDNVVLEEVEVEQVNIEDFIFFDYNRSNSSKNISLPGTFTDLRGNSVGSNASIPSYNSILLLRTDNNYPPENNDIKIKIIEPSNYQKFEEGEIIKIKVEIEKSNLNTIEKVEIFKNGLLVTTLIQEPYEFDLENQTPGEFKLFAKAYDNQSKSFESEIVTISVEKKKIESVVIIVSPKEGDSFLEGENIKIEATTSDLDGTVKIVEFYQNNTLIGTVSQSPFSLVWNQVPAGSYQLTIKSIDDQGAVTISDPVSIIVSKPLISPTVRITSPGPNSIFEKSKPITVRFEASSPNGNITKIELFKNSELIGTANGNPNNVTFSLDNLQVGTFNLIAKVYDDKGASAVSTPLKITVIEPNIVPNINIKNPKNGDIFMEGTDVRIEADAEDPDGEITKVEFYRGSTLIGTSASAPHSTIFTKAPVGNYNLTAKAFDNKGGESISPAVNITIKPKIEIPWIELVTPISDQEFDIGSTIVFTVMFGGSDENVTKVEYYQGNQLIGTSSNSPFSYEWKDVTSGEYTIKAIAKGGNPEISKESQEVNIVVKPVTNPTFRIVSPTTNSTIPLGSDIEIEVQVPASVKKIKRVEFYRGNQILGSNNKAPFNYIWKNVPKGEINLVARLVYEDNSVLLSAVVKLLVIEEVIPSIIINYEIEEVIDKGDKPRISFEVSFVDLKSPVVEVEYFANGISLGVSDTEPYNFIWEDIEPGIYLIEAVAKAQSGLRFYSEEITIEITEKEKEISFSYVIGPNPTSGYLNIIFENMEEDKEFEILVVSMNGNISETFNTKTVNSNITLDLSFLRRGSYILYLNNGAGYISSVKFIKK